MVYDKIAWYTPFKEYNSYILMICSCQHLMVAGFGFFVDEAGQVKKKPQVSAQLLTIVALW